MDNADRLEIIGPDGQIKLYSLNLAKGFTNIGGDPENDIVIADPQVPPFQAVLVHQRKPYRLVLLNNGGEAKVSDQLLAPHQPCPLQHRDTFKLGGHTLILIEQPGQGGGATGGSNLDLLLPPPVSVLPPPRPAVETPAPIPPTTISPPSTRPEPILPVVPVVPTPIPVVDYEDDIIITEMATRRVEVEVEQRAVYELTLINGGSLVATFNIRVEGLDETWVHINPPQVNLYEGKRAKVTIIVEAPRLPTSSAGPHHFAIIITSANYPNRVNRRGATLVINPYYEFSVGEINPRRQSISWFTRFARTVVPITNNGNSHALFQVDSRDDERKCNFEFQVPGESVTLANQAELRIFPGQTLTLPLLITPQSRPLVALRKHSYAFTVTTTLPEGAQLPRSMLGQLNISPLFGPLLLLLLTLLLLVLIVFIFRPTISDFRLYDGGQEIVVKNGTPAALYWKGGVFTTLRIDPEPNPGLNPLPDTEGTVVAMPKQGITYTLRGENRLSRLLPIFAPEPKEVQVLLTPIPPTITFQVRPETITPGEKVALKWTVNEANKVVLVRETNGVQEIIPLDEKQQSGGRLDLDDVEQDTVFTLSAENDYAQTTPIAQQVRVVPPPIPTPVVKKFVVHPQVVVAGTPVSIEWEVEGADTVSVQPIGEGLPAAQSVDQSPLQTTNYILNASYKGAKIPSLARQVFVTPAPTPTLEPIAPVIEYFTASPQEIIQGEADTVDLAWSVKGDVTDVQINGPGFGTVTNLDTSGTFRAPINQTTLFVLTAFNGDKKSNANVQVKVTPPTPVPPPPPPPPPPTPTPLPPMIIFFNIKMPDEGNEVTPIGQDAYEVIAGGGIYFTWEVQNATKVTLSCPSCQEKMSVNLPFKGDWPIARITSSGSYQLIAENAAGKTDIRNIQINMTIEVPSAPFNIRYTDQTTDTLTLTWDYSRQDQSRIDGFTIYEIDGNGDRTSIVTDLAKSARRYEKLEFKCERAYVVVAIYTDINGDIQEVGYGDNFDINTRYTNACPTPSP